MLEQQNGKKAAQLLKALAHPERLLILCHLLDGEQTAGELWRQSDLSQSSFSQHLAVLRKENIVQIRKEAQTIYYSIMNQDVLHIMKALQKIYC